MLATEWNLEDAIRVTREETWEKAWNKAREETWGKDRDMVFNIMNRAKSMDELKRMLEKSFSGEAR